MRLMDAFVIAFSTYTRIPMPHVQWSEESRRYAMCFFPLVGAAVGLLLWGWLALCDALGVGPVMRGAAGALIPLLVTGGIHMDGLMDVSDAIASWQTQERRLEILKDSHTGAFAVMACAGYLLLTAGLLSEADAVAGRLLAPCFLFPRHERGGALHAVARPRRHDRAGHDLRNARVRDVVVQRDTAQHDIPVGEHAAQPSGAVRYGQRAEIPPPQQPCRRRDRLVLPDGDDFCRHDLLNFHNLSSLFGFSLQGVWTTGAALNPPRREKRAFLPRRGRKAPPRRALRRACCRSCRLL